ncbi:tRNA (guanine-N(7)-)-methyltransferase non-catalytic subunit WDR4-like [Daphnia pulex]|uniref:tRNA (guanine-N(7)-)-methyltransferase non-catalytic subunit WDR4-like n=1 Tax=Daphnia pulex TaxID=6669 RepID=UPI001EDE5168|nr:tRNA (guanine-N(7)-)-methyltransferase non-catalytic subunit WDR4-like [Daphnia pulex]
MAPFVARGNLIAIGSEVSILTLDTTTGILKHASIPLLPESHAEKTKQEPKTENKQPDKISQNTHSEDYSHLKMGTCLALSPCASFLAVCTSDKNLTVWKLSSMDVLKQWKAARKVSSLTFNSDSSQLLVADKAGDCFTYSLNEPTGQGKLILGHLSMLLAVVVSSDNKFVITSERDEKIRVSCLPNAYNIHSYCLGHTEFITSLAFIQNNLLLSGSGDGTLRVWDYLDGKMLHTETLKETSDEEMEKAVRSVVVYNASETMSIAAVLLDRIKTVFLFKIIGAETKFQRQTLPFVAQPLEAAFTESGSLYVLTDSASNPIEYFGKDESFLYTLGESAVVGNLLTNLSHLKIVQECVQTCNGDLKPLFKRWFDNVQVYRERKIEQQVKPKAENSDITSSPKRLRVE